MKKKNTMEIEKGKEEKRKKKKVNINNAGRQHERGIRILQASKECGGGVAPRPNNTIT